MNNAACCVPTIPFHRPWWARAAEAGLEWWAERRRREAERAVFLELAHLSEQTLRDIGVPAGLHARDREVELRRVNRQGG